MGGAAKVRKDITIYHHTSILRTNLIWMAGVVEVEGRQGVPLHPVLGEVQTDIRFRRALKDFPAVAWFTRNVNVPGCLKDHSVYFQDRTTGESTCMSLDRMTANGITLRRMALGFPAAAIPVVKWNEHYGYATAEGRELNETAIACGDDPDDWYVAETAVPLKHMTEIRAAKGINDLKMVRNPEYHSQIMALLARMEVEPAYIPPTWMSKKDATALAASLNLRMG